MNRECGAKAKTNGRQPCRRLAMANGRCHLHGGMSTGAKTLKGRYQQKMSSWKHGFYSKESIDERKSIKKIIKDFSNKNIT